jgi:hypothetical protein
MFSDSTLYAHYVFKAFDVNSNGAISFRVSFFTIVVLIYGMKLIETDFLGDYRTCW